MIPGEVLIANLNTGATIVRLQEEQKGRLSILLDKNKLARIPHNRVLLATGVLPNDFATYDDFRSRAEAAAENIDLSEVWEILTGDQEAISLDGLAELIWPSTPKDINLSALVIQLDLRSDLFERTEGKYIPRTREAVEKIHLQKQREAENARDAEELVIGLRNSHLPEIITKHQESLVNLLKGYAIHGEDLPKRSKARELVEAAMPGTRDLQRTCYEILPKADVFDKDEFLELTKLGISYEFPDKALEEVQLIKSLGIPIGDPREDLRDLEIITIDDEGTVDRDDAISLENTSSGYRLGIHITDAGTLVPKSGEIDVEADHRMASLYLPERTIPMLPDSFTHSIGSLDPNSERPALSILVDLNSDWDIAYWKVVPSIIKSSKSLSYDEIDDAIETTGRWHDMASRLHELSQVLRNKRSKQGAITLDQPEMKLKVHSSDQIEVQVRQRWLPGQKLVAEIMILCNSLLADLCATEGIPAIYRTQSRPETYDAPDLSELHSDEIREELTRYNIARHMKAAQITTIPLPHQGLGVEAYLQATSPLRRYPDLLLQRQINSHLAKDKPSYSQDEMNSIGHRAEMHLREYSKLEAARKRYWFLKFLDDSRIPPNGPNLFEAIVLENENRPSGLTVLREYPFRIRVDLPKTVLPGEVVTLRLEGVDLWRLQGFFVYVP